MQAGGQRFESVILHLPFLGRKIFDILAQAKQNEEAHPSVSGGCVDERKISNEGKESKGAWWMPRLTEATKDVVSCEKPRVGANGL